MPRRRVVYVGLIVTLLIITWITCCQDSSQDQKSSIEKVGTENAEPMEISISLWGLGNLALDDPILEQVEKKLNIKIKQVAITNTDYVQQYQIWASSGKLPDIFAVDAISSEYLKNWVKRGVIKALPDDLSAYPYLEEYLSTYEIQYLRIDGKLYSIPRKTYDTLEYDFLDRVVVYRWDLAQKAGITKEPESWEEFHAMLEAIISKDPENKQISGLTAVNDFLLGGLFWLYGAPAATSDGSGSDFKWIYEDDRYIPAVFSKHAIESLKMVRQFYTSGLIDQDLPVTRGEMAFDKFAQGKVAALISTTAVVTVDNNIYKDRWLKTYPDEKAFYDKVKILKPLPSFDGNRYHAIFKSFWSESYISSNADDQKMDRILQLFNYLNTPEFLEMRRFGIKGVDYEKSGDKITKIYPDEDLFKKYKGMNSIVNLLSWDLMFMLDPSYSHISPQGHQAQREHVDYSLETSSTPAFNMQLTYLSTPTKDSFTIFDSEDMIRVMLSEEPVEMVWQDIINGYKEKGLDTMIEEVNAKAMELGITQEMSNR